MMRFIIAYIVLFMPITAHARWLEASSTHFIVYANDSENNIRRFSEYLERYHSALSILTGAEAITPSPSNRVTVFVVNTVREVRKISGDDDKNLAGFYIPRAGASLAIIPQVDAKTGTADFSMVILLHEYAHHFMISGSNFAMPRWLSEGGAEFFASASFSHDGGISLGRPAGHRAAELMLAPDVTAEALLDPAIYERKKKRSYDAFYGKSWLLYHYLAFEDSRKGQMTQYIKLLTEGAGAREAALTAFGDFAVLEKELDKYLRQPRMKLLSLKPQILETGPVTVRALREGEAAMIPVRIRSQRGVNSEMADDLLPQARQIAARYPNDPAVLAALAEAEHDAGNDKEAIAAADAALALDKGQVNAYVQKGYSLFRIARDADNQEEAYKQARAPFITLNHLENDHPLPLYYFYLSYERQGKDAPEIAMQGLRRATELAPFDDGLRMTYASALIRSGKSAQAREQLKLIAYAPHGGDMADIAARMIAKIEAEPEWRGSGIEKLTDRSDQAPR